MHTLLELNLKLDHIVPNYKRQVVKTVNILIGKLAIRDYGPHSIADTVRLIEVLSKLRPAMYSDSDVRPQDVDAVDGLLAKYVRALGQIN